ncbi:hypothetical protein GF326_12865 [Candidatus Bathyarchaeota archaeon]|nr:hypothetical protein [Candidatus Bathyarchaeota archaeon]
MSYGKPSVIIPMPKHPEQYGNARRAVELGVARALHQRDVSLDSLVGVIDEVLASGRIRGVLSDIVEKEHLNDGLRRAIEVVGEFLG